MKARLLTTLGLAILFVSQASQALPCSCVCLEAPKATVDERLEEARGRLHLAEIVFLGRVTGVKRDPMSYPELQGENARFADHVATVEVIRDWKGGRKDSYALTSSGMGCGYAFKVGEVHLFYLRKERERFETCCPGPTPEELRESVRELDRITGKKPLKLPKELRRPQP